MIDPARDLPSGGVWSGLLIAAGVLVLTVFGTPTLIVGGKALTDLVQGQGEYGGPLDAKSLLYLAAILGLPPNLVGALLLWAGLRRRRVQIERQRLAKPPPSAPPPG